MCLAILTSENKPSDICPNTNPTLIGLNYVLDLATEFNFQWSNRGQYLQNVDCVSDLGYVTPLTTGSLYNPANTPAPGTQTLFNEPGQMTTPASGAVFTWYAFQNSVSFVVTALSSEKAVATGPAGATSTGSGSYGSTTKRSLQPSVLVVFALFMGLGFCLFL